MSPKEARWIQQLQNGEERAFAEFFKQYRGKIYQLALKILNDPVEAEDVLQEVLLTVFKRVDSFQGQSQLSTWVYRVTVNAALMRLRAKKRETFLNFEETVGEIEDRGGEAASFVFGAGFPGFTSTPEPEQDLARKELGVQICSALAELNETKAQTFLLKNLYSFSDQELSRRFRLSVSALKSQLYRSRRFLRQRLQTYVREMESLPG